MSLAAGGAALVAAGYSGAPANAVPIGFAVLAASTLGFLAVQFWTSGVQSLAHATPSPAPPVAKVIDFSYEEVVKPQDPADEEDLVEFELVKEPTVPTKLRVPSAFAAPPARRVQDPILVAPTGTGAVERVPASARTEQIVSGLPILSSIFSRGETTTAAEPAERPGKTRGQCSSCGTFLWAPTQRPIRLRCPKCGHVRTLTG